MSGDENEDTLSDRLKPTDSDKGAVPKTTEPTIYFGKLKRSRATHKRKVTLYIKKLEELFNAGNLTSSLCKSQIKLIEDELNEIKGYDAKISEFLDTVDFSVTNPDLNDQEMDGQAEYAIEVTCQLDPFYIHMVEQAPSKVDQSTKNLISIMSNINMDGKPPTL